MPYIVAVKVWPLPVDLSEEQYREIHLALVEAAGKVPVLGVKGEGDMTVGFPRDLMAYGLGTDLTIEVMADYFSAPLHVLNREVNQSTALQMIRAVKRFFPEADVKCFVVPNLYCTMSPAGSDKVLDAGRENSSIS